MGPDGAVARDKRKIFGGCVKGMSERTTEGRRHVIVDGYNTLHALPGWKRLLNRDPAAARERLLTRLRVLHDFEGCRLSLVFDGPGDAAAAEPDPASSALTVVFAPAGLTADGVIERMVLASSDPEAIVVVTHDRMIGEVAWSRGASVMGAAALEEWVGRCRSRMERGFPLSEKPQGPLASPFEHLPGKGKGRKGRS